jgi:DNA damage-binding protein 1
VFPCACSPRSDTLTSQLAKENEFVTLATGSVYSRSGRPVQGQQLLAVDPLNRAIALHFYEGIVSVLPVDPRTGAVSSPFEVRLDELDVFDLVFLHTPADAAPQLALLYEDEMSARHVASYSLFTDSRRSLERATLRLADAPVGACRLMPVPPPIGGLLVATEQTIVHVDAQARRTVRGAMPPASVSAMTRIDADGSRWLLGDHLGGLRVVVLRADARGVQHIDVEVLGRTSAASCLAYLDNGVVFLGSMLGDSQLLRLVAPGERAMNADDDNNNNDDGNDDEPQLQVIETYANLGPIVDMCVVDLERDGQGQLVTCSGAFGDGSLRVVRNGVGIEQHASVDLEGVRRLWSLRGSSAADAADRFIVMSFVAATRILAFDGDELEERDIGGFVADAPTLCAATVGHDQLLQVTAAGARLVAIGALERVAASWQVDGGASVSAATANAAGQVVLALAGGSLVYLRCGAGKLELVARAKLPHEIACVDVSPIGGAPPPASGADLREAAFCAVGLWHDASVRVLHLPSLAEAGQATLGRDLLPRSLLLAELAPGAVWLLAGLGDGALVSHRLTPTELGGIALDERKQVVLGTRPVQLTQFNVNGKRHVFAALDRPAVVYAADDGHAKLRFANVDLRDVGSMCALNTAAFADSLCVADEQALTIGTVDDVQRLHVRTYTIDGSPRHIAYQAATASLVVLVDTYTGDATDIATALRAVTSQLHERSHVRLFDAQSFAQLDSHPLDANEKALSVVSLALVDENEHAADYYVVGTAIGAAGEVDASAGRLLVFAVRERRLQLVSQTRTAGGVYSLDAFERDGVVGGVGCAVSLWRWRTPEAGDNDAPPAGRQLRLTASKGGHVLAVTVSVRGSMIVCGDVMQSVSVWLVSTDPVKGDALELVARDSEPNWLAAIAVLDDETFLGAENSGNLFSLRRAADAANDIDRFALEAVGEYHVGDFVNALRAGSLVMAAPSNNNNNNNNSEAAAAAAGGIVVDDPSAIDVASVLSSVSGRLPTVLYGTAKGAIGVVASVTPAAFVALKRIEDAVNSVVRGVGGFTHAEFRQFRNERKTVASHGFVDGDVCESFLELPTAQQQQVADVARLSVDDVMRLLEAVTLATH